MSSPPAPAAGSQRLVILGKAHALGLGSFHLVPLARALELALANRRLARGRGDRRAASRPAAGMPTFEEAAAKVIAIHGAAWRTESENPHRSTRCENLLSFLFLQNVAHAGQERRVPGLRQRLGPLSAMAGFQPPTNGRIWALTQHPDAARSGPHSVLLHHDA